MPHTMTVFFSSFFPVISSEVHNYKSYFVMKHRIGTLWLEYNSRKDYIIRRLLFRSFYRIYDSLPFKARMNLRKQ